MCRPVSLEEEIYRMNAPEAEAMLNVFAEDEPSIRFILSNLFSGVREQIVYGSHARKTKGSSHV